MPVPPVASRATACQTRDDNTKERNDAIDDGGEHVAYAGDNCHNDTADGSEDGLETRYDGTHDE